MADPQFSSALQAITGMPDPLAFPKARPLARGGGAFIEQPVAEAPAEKTFTPPEDIPLPEAPDYEAMIAEPSRKLSETQAEYEQFLGEKEADTAKREATQARRKLTAAQKYAENIQAEEIRKERDAFEAQLAKPFLPTQQNFSDLATMYSLIGVLGFAIGAGGKGNALQAMSAMNGMIEGYREGRIDLYEKEKDAFEYNAKALKTKVDSLNNKIKEIAELAKVDYEKADMEADVMFAEEGATFLKNYKDKVGLVGTIKMLQEKVKAGEKLFEFMTKERSRVAEINKKAIDKFEENVRNIEARREQAEQTAEVRRDLAAWQIESREFVAGQQDILRRELADQQSALRKELAAAEDKRVRELQAEREREDAARQKERLEEKKAAEERDRVFRKEMEEGRQRFEREMAKDRNNVRMMIAQMSKDKQVGLKPSDTAVKGYRGDYQLLADFSYIRERLKDPELRQQMKDYKFTQLFSEKSEIASALLQPSVPRKLREFATFIADMRNNKYLDNSGKAVTGGEALRNYNAIAQPSDDAETMSAKVNGAQTRIIDRIKLTRELYPSLPDLSRAIRPGNSTGLTLGQDYSFGASDSSIAAPKPMPTGQKLIDYAKTHFNGDQEKAKTYLRSQGYQ